MENAPDAVFSRTWVQLLPGAGYTGSKAICDKFLPFINFIVIKEDFFILIKNNHSETNQNIMKRILVKKRKGN